MHLYDGPMHIGIVAPTVLREGSAVLFQHFIPGSLHGEPKVAVRKLALLEVSTFVAEQVPAVRTIRFALGGRVRALEDGTRLASARSAMLRSIGVPQIKVTPNPDAAYAGQFVVAGVWERSPKTLAALKATLEAERRSYGVRKAIADSSGWRRLVAKITNFLTLGEDRDPKTQSW